CHLCHEEVNSKKIVHHVGAHLLAHKLRIPEQKKLLLPIGEYPCGFCGRSGTCSVNITKPAKTPVPSSDCPYSFKFSLASAANSTSSGPCTNRPM
ncbi:hypothetical protein FIBSPDRAFT_667883, partial [Athelia psychrophila]